MSSNTAKNQPEQTMTDPFSGVTFRVIDGGKSDNPQKPEFRPVNPHAERAESEARIKYIREAITEALKRPDILEHGSTIHGLMSKETRAETARPKEDRWNDGLIQPVRPTQSPKRRRSELGLEELDEPLAA